MKLRLPGELRSLILCLLGRGGGIGQVVSVLAFSSDNLSLNPAEAYSFSVIFV